MSIRNLLVRSCSIVVVVMLLGVFGLAGVSYSLYTTDCNGDPKGVYSRNETICLSGAATGKINIYDFYPCADAYITHPRENSPWATGDLLWDLMGSENRLCNEMMGGFLDQVIALPPLKVGRYSVILDQNGDGKFNPPDQLMDYKIEVVDLGHPLVDSSAIKGAALAISNSYTDGIQQWQDFCDFLDALGAALNLMAGDVFGAAINIAGHFTGIPTDYNDAVKSQATQLIGAFDKSTVPEKASGIYGTLAKHWYDLYQDPPDANYTVIAPLDFAALNAELAAKSVQGAYPFEVKGSDPREAVIIKIANRSIEQAALVKALRQSYEKYQGAAADANYEYAFTQIEQAKQYGEWLAGDMAAMKNDLLNVKNVYAAYGTADTVVHVAELQAIKDRMIATGLDADEIASLKSVGFSDARIQLLIQSVKAIQVPAADFSMNSSITALIAQIDAAIPGVQSFNTNALATMNNLIPEFALHRPLADAGGPYSGVAGTQISLNGGNSSDPDVGDTLTYEWDLNGDGVFGDVAGKNALYAWSKAYSGLIGLKVTDTTNRTSIGYAQVFISAGNSAPVMASFTPTAKDVGASIVSPLTFTVAATDPDNDPLTYEWTVNGVAVGTGTSYTLTPGANESGTKTVLVTVRDNNPASRDTVEGRSVRIFSDADGDGYDSSVDCNDNDATVHPGALEILNNGKDDDCNAATPDFVCGGNPPSIFYRDTDGDGFGNSAQTLPACSAPTGYVANNQDCNDADATVHPGVAEVCNGKDDNCNGQIDEGVATAFYQDADGDGYGNPLLTVQACFAPAAFVTNNSDCNDTSAVVNPGATEVLYDGIDNDCNPLTFDTVDADGDGYPSNLDCNDSDPTVNPGRREILHNGKNDDCNAATMDNWSKSFVVGIDDASNIYYAKSNGDGTFSNYRTLGSLGGATSRGIAIEDFNGDGYLDFIAGRGNGSMYLYNNDGNDNFTNMGVVGTHSSTGGYAMDMAAGDFNNDGFADFIANGNSSVTNVFLNDGNGGFTRTAITHTNTLRGLDVADFNGDGNLDFAVSYNGTNNVKVYKGNGNGTFVESLIGTATSSGNDNYALAAADFDNDGKPDIIVSGGSTGDAYLFKGNGDGTFLAGVLVPSLDINYYSAMDAYDFNNDGNIDVVMADHYSGGPNNWKMWFFPGNGDGTFGARTAISPSPASTWLLAIAAPPTSNRVSGFPFAAVSPKTQSVAVGANAALNGLFSYDAGGSIAQYDWKFGDGATVTGATVAHPYTAEGKYTATLTVTDNSGNKDRDLAQVTVVGNPPVANAGGPYTFGEQYASGSVYTVPLNGSGSTDDFGIVKYAWDFSPLSDSFNGTTLDSAKWIASTGVTQNGKVTIVGASGWDTRYLFSQETLIRENGLTIEMRVKPGTATSQQAMFGVKNTSSNYSYTQMPHAFFLYNGTVQIYEDGSGRGQVATFTRGVQYDLKLELKTTGALYYMRETGKTDWQLIYTSAYSSLLPLKVGGTVLYDTYELDDVTSHVVVYGPTPNKLLSKGTVPVTLTVTDKAGQQASDSTTITTVTGAPPVSNPGGPYTQDETTASANVWTVAFDGSASTDDTGIESYSWNFGDGSALGTGVKPNHVYTGAGVRTVTLTVTDKSGQSDTKTTTVTISANAFPVANPGGPYNVTEDLVVNKHWSISVDAVASTDDVGIWKYEWNFGDGTGAVATKTATHTYAAPGTYTVTLKVTDHANQAHTATTTAAVVATAAPTASPGGPYFSEPNTPVNFDGSGSTDNTGILSYSWNFGDGTTGKGAQPSHAYSAAGTYTVTLTVKDTALQTATATTTVAVAVGNAPVADAGGPYTSNVGVPVRLNGSASTDDHGIVSYAWVVGEANIVMMDGFNGTAIDSAKWLYPASGVTQNGAVTLTGSAGWGSRYLFSKDDFALEGTAVVAGQITQTVSGYLMFGFKNTDSTNFSYTQMPYALYFAAGSLQIYEGGASRGSFGSYAANTLYDVKIELKSSATGAVAGARYYYKPATSSVWNLLYDSSYVPASTLFKVGVTYYGGTFVVDAVSLTAGSRTLSGEKPVIVPTAAGVLPVQLTVTDGAGQTSTASSTLTVSSDPLVITAPWQFTGGVEVPHDTWSGEEVILKAVVKSGKGPITYSWDFGDGTSSTPTTVTNSYNLSARHTYTAADGTPITARITVTDADGKSSTDTFPIIVRPKSLNIEVNKTIDDGLWYIHTTQNRANGSWESSGYSGGYFSSPTASAIHSMEINGHLEVGDFSNDPYVEDVWQGMQYVLTTLNAPAIADQAYGDPDVNGNGYGVQVNSGRPIYEGGQVMMALVASGTPNMKAVSGGAGILGRTYRDIVQDMAEMYYWGQNDIDSGGAWQYSWNYGNDNSASQWAVLGLEAAEEQNWVKIPQWVRDRNIIWLATSRSGDGNGYGYTSAGNGVATTPSGLAQVAFNKIPTTDERWKKVENFLASYWNNWYNGSGNYYALYSLAKSLRTAKPKEITILGEGTANAIDWYNDPTRGMARTIVNQQDANGMFVGGTDTKWAEGPFRTAWGVIILTKTLFVLPPVAVAGDNKVWGVDWPLTLDGSKSYHLDPFRKIVKYEWDIDGDGVYDYSSDQPTVTHTYSAVDYPVSTLPKTFKVSLRVTDNNDPAKYDTSTVNIVIAVPPHPPVAVPGGPYTGFVGVPLQLDGSASYDIDPTDIITAYGWELDGVYPYNFTDATGVKPTYTFTTPGTYNIGLQVTDNGVLSPNNAKLSDTKWTTITIKPNNVPVANAGGPYTVNEGATVPLDGSASMDPDGNPLTFSWDLDNDGTFETAGVTPNFSQLDNGIFTVSLKVSDGALESIATAAITVQNVAPVVSQLPNATIDEGSTFAANGFFSDPGADTWTATVDFGDGAGAQPLALASKAFSLNHLYPQNGSYSVTVTVTDKDGAAGSTSALITVVNVAPLVNAGPDALLADSRDFISSGSFTDPGADSWTATVDYGDGSGVQLLALNLDKSFALNHTYTANGMFTVTVTVKDSDGAVGTDTALVTINNRAPAVNAGPDAAISEGSSFSSSGSFSDQGSISWSATVNYGDGSGVQPLALNPDKSFALNHQYAQNGIYTVTVVVTDDGNATGGDTATVTVGNLAPTVNAGPDQAVNEGAPAGFSGSFTDPGVEDSHTILWDFGDGATATNTLTPVHAYASPGTYTVTLTVTDNAGGSGSDTAIVTVNKLIVQPVQTITNLLARAKPGKADITWSCVPGNVTYNIYRGTTAGGPYSRIKSGHTSTYCTYADIGLTNGTTYYWRVTSVDAGGLESLYSNEASARPVSR